jgi:ATP-dependent helicase/nuclease subunit B
MAGRSARAPYGQHPRVSIYGTMEARTQRADRMILGGLNEGSWPSLPDPDPWMSRAMRRAFGLPALERRLGLSAHDFQQAISARDVILTRARKQDGAPTVPSRWLQRMVTLLGEAEGKGYAPGVLAKMRSEGAYYLRRAMGLGEPEGDVQPCCRPRPKPPVEVRPRRLSVTEVETLIRDPYAIYAKHVLCLHPVASLVPEPDARTRGNIMHGIVEHFVRETQHSWPVDDPVALFARLTEEELAQIEDWPSYQAFYRARAERVGPAFVTGETARRDDLQTPVLLEAKGECVFDVPGLGSFELRARVDRIDLTAEATYAVYDYKGASGPTNAQVQNGWAQQLPLQGAMVAEGAFEVPARPVSGLVYIKLKGGEKAVEEIAVKDPERLVESALDRLRKLLAAYADQEQPYVSQAMPETVIWEGDYDHLARLGEWEDRS